MSILLSIAITYAPITEIAQMTSSKGYLIEIVVLESHDAFWMLEPCYTLALFALVRADTVPIS